MRHTKWTKEEEQTAGRLAIARSKRTWRIQELQKYYNVAVLIHTIVHDVEMRLTIHIHKDDLREEHWNKRKASRIKP